MVKISKYFSLFKFSITHPKGGVDMFNAAMQTHDDSKQKIKKHTAKSLKLEKILDELFPNNGFTKKKIIEDTKELQIHFKDYFDKLRSKKFPSKEKPYPIDYSIYEDSGLLLYALCKIVKPDLVVIKKDNEISRKMIIELEEYCKLKNDFFFVYIKFDKIKKCE